MVFFSEHPLLIEVVKLCSNLLWSSSILLEFELRGGFHTPTARYGGGDEYYPLGQNMALIHF